MRSASRSPRRFDGRAGAALGRAALLCRRRHVGPARRARRERDPADVRRPARPRAGHHRGRRRRADAIAGGGRGPARGRARRPRRRRRARWRLRHRDRRERHHALRARGAPARASASAPAPRSSRARRRRPTRCAAADIAIVVLTGPEVVTGSTRMKAGTATKLVLNTITTGAMIRLGKTYGNLMVDLQASNAKLRDRAERIVCEVCGVTDAEARDLLRAADGSVKLAIVMQQAERGRRRGTNGARAGRRGHPARREGTAAAGRARVTVLVGLMSGTSLDGISAAVVQFQRIGRRHRRRTARVRDRPYTHGAARAPGSRSRSAATPQEYARLDFDLGAWLADAAVAVMAEAGVARADIAAIASHGHTVWHDPPHATWQIGNAAVIAERTGVAVISDFRSRDVAAGGQGAPLVTIADAMLFSSPDKWRATLNLGGIANLQLIPPGGVLESVRAFDTGPGVCVIDATVRALAPNLAYDVGRRARPARHAHTRRSWTSCSARHSSARRRRNQRAASCFTPTYCRAARSSAAARRRADLLDRRHHRDGHARSPRAASRSRSRRSFRSRSTKCSSPAAAQATPRCSRDSRGAGARGRVSRLAAPWRSSRSRTSSSTARPRNPSRSHSSAGCTCRDAGERPERDRGARPAHSRLVHAGVTIASLLVPALRWDAGHGFSHFRRAIDARPRRGRRRLRAIRRPARGGRRARRGAARAFVVPAVARRGRRARRGPAVRRLRRAPAVRRARSPRRHRR